MGLFGGLLDGLLEKALEEAFERFGYADDQLADWLGYLGQDAPQYFDSDGGGGIHVAPHERQAFARAAMQACWNTLMHGSPPKEE